MVAISLYKGNLHKAPDVVRRWPTPAPTMSPKVFKILIHRRSRALARLQSISKHGAGPSNADPPSNSNPSNANSDPIPIDNALNDNRINNHDDDSLAAPKLPPEEERKEEKVREVHAEVKDDKLVDSECSLKNMVEKADALVEKDDKSEGKDKVPVNPVVERSNIEDANSGKEKRKKELQEKLEILNEKKHSLVQVLKQILNAEEQLKRQTSMQGMSGRGPLPLQVDTTTDSGSQNRVNTPRMGSDGNPCGDMDGGEADDVSKPNVLTRQLPRMSSLSPSSESQLLKSVPNMKVPHTFRTTPGATGSPSRFAPAGQGHSVSVSGTSYITSSPSPVASGGTSVFRDGRLPSPWN